MSGHDKELTKHGPPSIVTAATTQTITVEVGPNCERFFIHKVLLVHHSEYFAAATRGSWKDTQDGVVPLHDVESTTFRLFVHWLYTKTIPATSSYGDWSPIIDRSLEHDMYDGWVQEAFMVLIKAYVFGDKFLATGFRQDVNQKFSNLLSGYCLALPGGWKVIEYAFNHVPLDRLMIQYLVDDYCDQWDETKVDHVSVHIPKWLPRAFPVRVERRFAELRSTSNNVRDQSRCYYEHTSEEERKKCRYLHMFYHEVEEYGYFYDDDV